MWAAGGLPMAIPAACPRVCVSEWSFRDAVGVDCSAPEPRCIWVAVLRSDAPNTHTPHTPDVGGGRPSRAPHRVPREIRAKGRRDGTSSSSENPRPVVVGGSDGRGMSWQGPRTLLLQKNSQGFGFTLRHFIVYPPESALHTSLKDEENGNEKGLQRSRLEPMDTIFVKNVRERGPAHQAGLCTGDRLVKVNGESVLGKTYSQVIALIQNSESVLELSIMPKDEDVLQLAYSQDAYLRGNEPYKGGAQCLPPPPPLCYPPRSKSQPPTSHTSCPTSSRVQMGQNQLDNWSRWPGSTSSGPSPPLDNRITVPAHATVWAAEGRACDPGGVGHSSPAHRTEEIRYGMTDRGQQAMGQMRGRTYSSSSSSGGALASPLHHGPYGNYGVGTAQGWASPPQPTHTPPSSHNERTQQALSNWYYSQVNERERERPSVRSLHPRHRSFSQDRLGEFNRTRRTQRSDFPHSVSQDTLLYLQQPGPGARGHWQGENIPISAFNCTRSENLLQTRYGHSGRSLEALDRAPSVLSPCQERPSWGGHQPQSRAEAYQRQSTQYSLAQTPPGARHTQAPQHEQKRTKPLVSQHPSQHQNLPYSPQHSTQAPQPQQAMPQTRRLPSCQSLDEQPMSMGYRSYSPSFNRKTGRILQHAHSFRDPSYMGPALSWTPTPKTSPPEGVAPPSAPSPAPPTSSATPTAPEGQDRTHRPTNHEREGGEIKEVQAQVQEVVLRQKPPMGRRGGNTNRHPHYGMAIEDDDPLLFTSDPTEAPPKAESTISQRRSNDEPTSPGVDLRACHVPASSVVSSGLKSAPAVAASPASPTFTFPLSRLFSHDCSSIKSSRRSSYLLAITTERSKSCDEGLNTFRDDSRIFTRLPKRVKSFFGDGSLESLKAAEDARSKRHSTSELGSFNYSDVRREGWLYYKQIHTEKGKKVGSAMRPWRRVFSVLRSNSLYLYKDKREALLKGSSLGGGSEDEQPISIRGCLVDIAYSETKRKNALRLTTQDFCEYLLQAEDRDDMLDWIKVIGESSKTDSEELGFSRQALINKKLNDYRKQSPTGNKPDSSPRVPRMNFLLTKPDNSSAPPRSPKHEGKEESSPPKSPWGINFMKKVKKAGPKAFGVRLEDCQPAASNKFIPLIVEICCGLVEEMGLEYTGIYRVPGNNAVVSSLQEQLDKGSDINTAEERWQDLNVVSSLLKSFFRKLPEPLFTDDKYNDFIEANRMENASDRLKTLKKLIHDLPDHYFHTLKFLVGHLKTVADHSEKNKMEPRNLALVFGPTLVRTSEDNMTDMVTHMPDRYKIVETLIQHYTWFFSEEHDKDEKTPVDTEDVQPAPNIDHLLSNIGRTGLLGDASDSTNSDSAKSKGSGGSKRDLSAKDFLTTLSIMSAVARRRRKRPTANLLGSSTDDDSEQEPIRAGLTAEAEEKEAELIQPDTAPCAEAEEVEDEEEDDEEEEEEGDTECVQKEQPSPSMPCREESQSVLLSEEEDQRTDAKRPGGWRGEDARSIVSGYSTLSTLGRSLASEGRGEDADDEQSELVSETDNESGFASRSLTQERPEKHTSTPTSPQRAHTTHTSPGPTAPRSFLYSNYKSPTLSPAPEPTSAPTNSKSLTPEPTERVSEGTARSSTPSTSSYSSSASQRLHSRPSFNSHRLIQCDTLARRRLKSDKAKARSLDLLELSSTSTTENEGQASIGQTKTQIPNFSLSPSPSSRTKLNPGSDPESSPAPTLPSEGRFFAPSGATLAEQVRARLLGSAEDLRAASLRKPISPETRRKRRAWRRHTVVASPTDASTKSLPLTSVVAAATGNNNNNKPPVPPPKPPGIVGRPGAQIVPPSPEADAHSARRAPPTSRFHECL
ncbi:rho GTPase-activating protein 23 isoform X2 [Astyanax mexicanus]|uniref:rho GTPase-activating protein 23 isoform X2 n=1 Tax=Astyanax mexicanus TaxID=7994 RepID=UPI0020CACB63|nr:rho GTPase-activating protein 23 isoform X2 [Astyanax mexicanus]